MNKEIIISVKNLTKDYGKGRGIFDVSFDIPKGATFGYCGTNGSGKTTTIRHIMGFLKPEHPEYPKNVFVCGDSANGASLVVRAMASGRQTAQKVNGFLQK